MLVCSVSLSHMWIGLWKDWGTFGWKNSLVDAVYPSKFQPQKLRTPKKMLSLKAVYPSKISSFSPSLINQDHQLSLIIYEFSYTKPQLKSQSCNLTTKNHDLLSFQSISRNCNQISSPFCMKTQEKIFLFF